MPFTPAHPAVILPFLRSRYCSGTGLVIGSLAPDFEYFFKMSASSNHADSFSHNWLGILYFDLPVTLALSLLFHLVVKRNAINNLPVFFQRRLQNLLRLDFLTYLSNRWVVFIGSALLGTVSHILWDGFTHNNTLFTRNLSIYQEVVVPYEGVRYPLFYALQNISSVVGVVVVIAYVVAIKPEAGLASVTKPNVLYWIVVILLSVSVVGVRFFIHPSDYQIGNLAVSCLTGLCVALVSSGLINFKTEAILE